MDINEFSTPINKTAALVTGQSNYELSDLEELDGKRKDLHLAWSNYSVMAKNESDKNKKRVIQNKLSEIDGLKVQYNIERKKIIASIYGGLERHIIDQCKSRFSESEWKVIIINAKSAMAKEFDGDEAQEKVN